MAPCLWSLPGLMTLLHQSPCLFILPLKHVCAFDFSLPLSPSSVQCTRNPLIFWSGQMSTVKEIWSVLLSWVNNFNRLPLARLCIFDANFLRHTGLYFFVKHSKEEQKILFFHNRQRHLTTNNQVWQYALVIAFRCCCGPLQDCSWIRILKAVKAESSWFCSSGTTKKGTLWSKSSASHRLPQKG